MAKESKKNIEKDGDKNVALTTENQEDEVQGDESPAENAASDSVEEPDQQEPTMDEKINAVGSDAPTVKRPKAPTMGEKIEGLTKDASVDRAAIVHLAKAFFSPPDFEDFKTLHPGLF